MLHAAAAIARGECNHPTTLRALAHCHTNNPLPGAEQGSGKTHTLVGNVGSPTERGVVPRAVAELARGIADFPEACRFKVGAACLAR